MPRGPSGLRNRRCSPPRVRQCGSFEEGDLVGVLLSQPQPRRRLAAVPSHEKWWGCLVDGRVELGAGWTAAPLVRAGINGRRGMLNWRWDNTQHPLKRTLALTSAFLLDPSLLVVRSVTIHCVMSEQGKATKGKQQLNQWEALQAHRELKERLVAEGVQGKELFERMTSMVLEHKKTYNNNRCPRCWHDAETRCICPHVPKLDATALPVKCLVLMHHKVGDTPCVQDMQYCYGLTDSRTDRRKCSPAEMTRSCCWRCCRRTAPSSSCSGAKATGRDWRRNARSTLATLSPSGRQRTRSR